MLLVEYTRLERCSLSGMLIVSGDVLAISRSDMCALQAARGIW
jgi:hypothetical protein